VSESDGTARPPAVDGHADAVGVRGDDARADAASGADGADGGVSRGSAADRPDGRSEPEPDPEPVVAATDAVREYRTGDETLRALDGVDLAVRPGEFVSVVGPSGSGKSTLLNLLGLLDVPTSGRVEVAGVDVAGLSVAERTRLRRRTVGFVFQSFHLVPTLTATENVMVPRLVGGDAAGAYDRAVSLLRTMGLGERLDHAPEELSGGQRQRVAIARSLINDPRLLLADEPTGNLDRDTGRRVLDEFARIADEDVAIVAVTHDEQVNRFADRVVTLVDGRVDPSEAGGA
jgi:putative ABC transport system ATP-binding protein